MSIVLTRATKQAARYTDAGGRERCSGCRFFMPQGTCGRIIGPVSPRGWCKYYSMEAVQRWQPQGAIGFGMGPSLALDFMSPGTMPTGIVFTRASTATYFDATGTLQTAAVNAPRWDYASGSLRGLLIEDARTNPLYPSAPSLTAPWFVTGPVTLGGSVTLPDATTSTAALLSATDTTNAVRQSYRAPGITASASTAYAVSAFMRRGNANGHIQVNTEGVVAAGTAYFDLTNGTAVVGADLIAGLTAKSVSITPLPNGWYRCTYMFTTMAGVTALDPSFGPCTTVSSSGDNRAYVGVVGQGVYVWGTQIEAGAFPTSYIPAPVGSAGTRAADQCYAPTAAWYNPATFSLMAEFDTQNVASVCAGVSDGVFANSAYLSNSAFIRTASVGGLPALTVAAVNKTCGTFNAATQIRVCNTGGSVSSAATSGVALSTATRLSAGMSPWGLDTSISGHIRRVRYWPRVLSDTEMQSITT